MKNTRLKTSRMLALLVVSVLAAGSAMVEKPPWAGGGKNGKRIIKVNEFVEALDVALEFADQPISQSK